MTKLVMDDISDKGNGELAVLVSGLGSLPVMELYVLLSGGKDPGV